MTLLALMLFALLPAPPQESPKELQAVFETSAGSFIVQFYPDQAPNHVRKFLQLAREGYFEWNRVSQHGVQSRGAGRRSGE